MVAGVFVVPKDRPDGGGHPRPNRPHDGAERVEVVSIRGVPGEQEQVDRPQPIQISGHGPGSRARGHPRPPRLARPRRTSAASMNLSRAQNSRTIAWPEARSTMGRRAGMGSMFRIFWYGVWACHVDEFTRTTPRYWSTPAAWTCPVAKMSGTSSMIRWSSASGAIGVLPP